MTISQKLRLVSPPKKMVLPTFFCTFEEIRKLKELKKISESNSLEEKF